MPRGGKREGAGRPKGSKSKATLDREALRERIVRKGTTPLEYMLTIMRDHTQTDRLRAEMAKAAAPYVHSALKAIEHTGDGGGPLKVIIEGLDEAL